MEEGEKAVSKGCINGEHDSSCIAVRKSGHASSISFGRPDASRDNQLHQEIPLSESGSERSLCRFNVFHSSSPSSKRHLTRTSRQTPSVMAPRPPSKAWGIPFSGGRVAISNSARPRRSLSMTDHGASIFQLVSFMLSIRSPRPEYGLGDDDFGQWRRLPLMADCNVYDLSDAWASELNPRGSISVGQVVRLRSRYLVQPDRSSLSL